MKKTALEGLNVGVLETLLVEFGCLRSRACRGHKIVGKYTVVVQEMLFIQRHLVSILRDLNNK